MSAYSTNNPNFNPPNINTLWAHAIVDELAKTGLRHVVISPGSRSTPLVLQFHAHPQIHDISIVDERSAAFFALGLAQATRQTVALLCTSGTAAANYFPAICEANQSNIPLLILTADRPPELHGCGAPQAMNQHNLYQNHVRAFHQLATPDATPQKLHALRSLICRAHAQVSGNTSSSNTSTLPGPVHINIPFDKPLEPTPVPSTHPHHVPQTLASTAPTAMFGRPNNQPYLNIFSTTPTPTPQTLQAFLELLQAAKRPLFLASADHSSHQYRTSLRDLAQHIGAPIAAEPTSNIRHWNQRGPNVLSAADLLFQSDIYHTEQPDLIIRTGRAPLLWASQKLVANLPENPNHTQQIIVGQHLELPDPDHITSHHFACDENLLFQQALKSLTTNPTTTNPAKTTQTWLTRHQNANNAALQAIHTLLADNPTITAPGLWYALANLLPEGCRLFVANSMPIRDLDTFMSHATQSLDVYFNRGINGIDGIIATGLGIAAAQTPDNKAPDQPTVIITGDVALRHDLASLLLAHELNINATVIVIDNNGGAIFEHLPIATNPHIASDPITKTAFQHHFITAPTTSIPQMLPRSIESTSPLTWPELRQALTSSLNTPGLQLIHLKTSRKTDKTLSKQLTNLFNTTTNTISPQ